MKTSSFGGKVAAITGAGSGIGRALALALARRDCLLALADIDGDGLEATRAAVGNDRCSIQRLDVADGGAMRAWADEVARLHGTVNLVFNNAGIAYGATVEDGDEADMRRVMEVDFWGVVHGTRAFLPHLKASGDGHVVNISSVAGLLGLPGHAAYSAAKFAVRGFTDTLRIECQLLQLPVSATCVHPGGIKTNIANVAKIHESLARFGVRIESISKDYAENFRTTAEAAAEIILRGVQKNRPRVLVGADAHFLDLVQRCFPAHYHGVVVRAFSHMVRRASPS